MMILNKNAAAIKAEQLLERERIDQKKREIDALREEFERKLREQEALLFEQETESEALEMQARIVQWFERNYELLIAESGNRLAPEVKEMALKQTLMYWEKMQDVAHRVTETEVKLSLPNLRKSDGSTFTLEGIVDIVRENDRTVLYDIKTHDYHQVSSNKPLYQKQLNVYAHIWQTLRGQQLDETSIICTAFPESLKEAISINDENRILFEVERWQPLVQIDFDQTGVDATIAEFTEVVERIENGHFAPPSIEKLQKPTTERGGQTFVTHVCRNCDARFACTSYRALARMNRLRSHDDAFYALAELDDFGSDGDRMIRRGATAENLGLLSDF